MARAESVGTVVEDSDAPSDDSTESDFGSESFSHSDLYRMPHKALERIQARSGSSLLFFLDR